MTAENDHDHSAHHHVHRARRSGFAARDPLAGDAASRAVWIAVAVIAIITVAGVVALWPGPTGERTIDPTTIAGDAVEATVSAITVGPCAGTSEDDDIDCRLVELQITGGEHAGDRPVIEQSIGGSSIRLIESGDRILVNAVELADGTLSYTFFDYQRSTPMIVLLLLFVGAVILLGRARGLGALAGLGASLLVLVAFVLPSLLGGNSPLLVALVGASAIAFIALFLAHGFDVATAVALLGTFASLALTGLLAWAFVGASKFTGFTDDSTFFLDALGTGIDARGILLAGIVIGSLGVLDDVTVTQVSAVWELRNARPEATGPELYGAALRIGRDHISSTVNTLFLAYAGAALPLLLLFSETDQAVSSVATREVVAVEIVRALVGSIGLIASVPITTGLAVRVLSRR
jgi:uncharacterized membrane protein